MSKTMSLAMKNLQMENELLIGSVSENLYPAVNGQERILHISHTDLDGVSSVLVDAFYVEQYNEILREYKIKADILQKHFYALFINPADLKCVLGDMLFHIKSDISIEPVFDKYIITDLNIPEDVFDAILDFGLEKFLIVDHHVITYNPEEKIINHPKYKDWTPNMIGEHCIITSTFYSQYRLSEKKTCATELFIHGYLIKQLENLKEFAEDFVDRAIDFQYEKLYFLGEAVRLWDTFEWKDYSPVSVNRVCALRLNLFLGSTSREYYRDYIYDYLTYGKDIEYMDLGHSFRHVNGDIHTTSFVFDDFVDIAEKKRNTYVEKAVQNIYHLFIPINVDEADTADLLDRPEYEEPRTIPRSDYMHIVVVNAERYASEIGDTIIETEPDVDFVMIIMSNTVSLRASKRCTIDISALARENGGGGHKAAAGFPLSKGDQYLLHVDLVHHLDMERQLMRIAKEK